MSDFTDKLRDKWEGITPRERGLVVLLGIAIPTVLIVFLGLRISDGLSTRETRVHQMRKALRVLQDLRIRGDQKQEDNDALGEMKRSPPITLETYVGKAMDKVQIAKPPVTPGSTVNKDGFVSKSVRFEVRDVTVSQLKDLLEALETGSKLVVVTQLTINRKFRDEDKDKLDAKLEVTTYAYATGNANAGSGSAAGSGSSS